jgi:cell division protein FtsB
MLVGLVPWLRRRQPVSLRAKILLLIALAMAAGFWVFANLGPSGGGKQVYLQSELDKLLEENQKLKEQNRRLTLEVEGLKLRREYQEKVARDELGLVKKDDLIFYLPTESKDGGTKDAASER